MPGKIDEMTELVIDRLELTGFPVRVGGAEYDRLGNVTAEPSKGVGYMVLYPEFGTDRPDRLGTVGGKLSWAFQLVCVGWTPTQPLRVAEAARDRLSGVTLPDNGRSMTPMIEDEIGARLIRVDKAPDQPRWSLTNKWNLNTQRS